MFKTYFKDLLVFYKDCFWHPIGATKKFYSNKNNAIIGSCIGLTAIGLDIAFKKIEEKKMEKENEKLRKALVGSEFIVY